MTKIKTLSSDNPELVTNINQVDFIINEPTEFEFSTVPGSKEGTMVKGFSSFDHQESLEKLEYYETMDGTWKEFSGESFGPSGGFPLTTATSKFRITFGASGTYTFTTYVSSVNNNAKIAECSATANVREYAKAEISSTFSSGENVKPWVPYEFTVSISSNDDAGKVLNGKVSFSSDDVVLEKLSTKKYSSFDGNITDILSSETYKFRATFNNPGLVTLKVDIFENESEYVTLSQELTVLEPVFPTATITVSDNDIEEHEIFDITFSVNANDYANRDGNYVYGFSSIEDIKSVEKYENGNWNKVDKASLSTPEKRVIKTEDIVLRVSFYNLGDYTCSLTVNDVKLAESSLKVSDNVEETEVAKITNKVLTGKTLKDTIVLYGESNSWSREEINAAILKYRNDYGKFALDYGLVSSENEMKLLNYASHYTLIDSVIRLGVIDLKKSRAEIKDLMLAAKDGVDEVLEVINTKFSQ